MHPQYTLASRTLMVLGMFAASLPVEIQAGEGVDATERSMAFIDRSSRATELFNANKPAEALAIFRDLALNYADLDEDGYAALSVGDCLAALGRDDEARAAYASALSTHPGLATDISSRLIELELAGEVTDAMIEQLRAAAMASQEGRHAAQWRLGRALQSRARSLLAEAAKAFRAAAGRETPFGSLLVGQADLLEELAGDLEAAISRADAAWGTARRPFWKRQCDGDEPASGRPLTEMLRCEWVARTKDGCRIEFQVGRDGKDGQVQVTANGKPIRLTRAQQLAIQRHGERINSILLEAAMSSAAK